MGWQPRCRRCLAFQNVTVPVRLADGPLWESKIWPRYFLNRSISTVIDRVYGSPRPSAKFHYQLQRYVKVHDHLSTLKTSGLMSVIFDLTDKPRRKRTA